MIDPNSAERRCEVCFEAVTNNNLGGHDGNPLSGSIYCLRCADDVRALSDRVVRVLRVHTDNVFTGARALHVALCGLAASPDSAQWQQHIKFLARGIVQSCNRLCLEIRRDRRSDGRGSRRRRWVDTVNAYLLTPKFRDINVWAGSSVLDNDVIAVCEALVELMLNPQWDSRRARLRRRAVELRRRCNRLVYRMNRTRC